MPQRVLNEDWDDYDNRKSETKEMVAIFHVKNHGK